MSPGTPPPGVPAITTAAFIKAAVKPGQYPPAGPPEVAFAGRSNVGKSSLINCLVQRKKLVRTSRTPGRTQTINFFDINGAFVFVDLPGYGYAKVPVQMRDSWGPMVEAYLHQRATLAGVVQIMDLRHPPTPDDLQLWNWLKGEDIPVLGVLTKADKVKPSLRARSLQRAAISLAVEPRRLIVFSATTREGRERLWLELLPWIEQPGPAQPL
jgi:GTP-binding protein